MQSIACTFIQPASERRTRSGCAIATCITGEITEHHAYLEPHIVRLAKGAVESAVCAMLEMSLRNLRRDPALDAGASMIQLLCTTNHLVLRFAQYRHYTVQQWQVVLRCNPKYYLIVVMGFSTSHLKNSMSDPHCLFFSRR